VDQLLRSFWHRLCSRDERDEEVRMFCSVGSLFSRSQSTVSSLFQLKLFFDYRISLGLVVVLFMLMMLVFFQCFLDLKKFTLSLQKI